MPHNTDHRALVREAIGKADPGLLKLLDGLKGKFDAKLVGYALKDEAGQWVGHGALKEPKP